MTTAHSENPLQSLPPALLPELLRVQPGMTVAELNGGHCHLTRVVSDLVGASGHVFAVEPSAEEFALTRDTSGSRQNVHPVEAPPHETPIAGDSCDRVVITNLRTDLCDPVATLREAARLLRGDGRLLVIGWDQQSGAGTRIDFREMIHLLERNTWEICRQRTESSDSYFLEAVVADESVQS